MGIFNREKFVLVNIETKEDVWENKYLVPREVVLEDIKNDNLDDALYRLEIRVSGRKIRNAWVMRKPKKKETAEEAAAKGREEAEAFMLSDALDIKDRVEKHNAFKSKVVEMYGIEGVGSVDRIQIPTGKDGNLGILEAAQIATAQSVFRGISETEPAEVSASFKSIMNSGTTILAGIAQMLTARMMESKKPKVKKEVEKKKEEVKKEVTPESKVETHKEEIGEGKTRITFGANGSTDAPHQKLDSTSVDIPKIPVPAITYEEYKSDMLREEEEVEDEEWKDL